MKSWLIAVLLCFAVVVFADEVYQSGHGNFSHMDVIDLTRALDFNCSGAVYESCCSWISRHVDVVEKDIHCKNYNPNTKVFKYTVDLAVPIEPAYYIPEDESAWLHLSSDTTIYRYKPNTGPEYYDTIYGCPEPDEMTEDCRMKVMMWNDLRYVGNVQEDSFRFFQIARIIEYLAPNYDGVFLDEHSPGLYYGLYFGGNDNNDIVKGGGIREYGGQWPYYVAGSSFCPVDSAYSADVAEYMGWMRGLFDLTPRFILPNPAEYYANGLADVEADSADGTYLEFVHDPFTWSTGSFNGYLNRIVNLSSKGVWVDLAGNWCWTGYSSYPRGNYLSKADRYKMWRYAAYLVARADTSASGIVWFDPTFCNNNDEVSDFVAEWLPAYEYNVGSPVGPFFRRDGNLTFARNYTNALVLVRPEEGYGGPWDATTKITCCLPAQMQILYADGSLGPSTNCVYLREAEALIMIPVDGSGWQVHIE